MAHTRTWTREYIFPGPPDKHGSRPKRRVTYTRIIPDWCEVKFPHRSYWYNDLARANNARIWARALFNIREQRGYLKRTAWSALAKEIGLLPKPPTKKQAKDNKRLDDYVVMCGERAARKPPWYPGIVPAHVKKAMSYAARSIWRARRPSSTGETVWKHAIRGKLPDDPVVRQKLFDIAGYPWE
jgi:hypothetical protein